MLILFTYKLLKGYLTCLKLNQFGFRWMCSRRILGDIAPRTRWRCSRPGKGFYRKSCYRRIYRAAPCALYENERSYRGSGDTSTNTRLIGIRPQRVSSPISRSEKRAASECNQSLFSTNQMQRNKHAIRIKISRGVLSGGNSLNKRQTTRYNYD